jgi:hypothetical protein
MYQDTTILLPKTTPLVRPDINVPRYNNTTTKDNPLSLVVVLLYLGTLISGLTRGVVFGSSIVVSWYIDI